MKEIAFVTSNLHKVEEMRAAFNDLELEINHIEMKYTELQADTIRQVVYGSIAELATVINGDFCIEDSGISIDALNDFPGPFSSFVYQTIGWEGILKLMREESNRKAHFTSIFAFWDGINIHTFEGITQGRISSEGKGSGGFGFDPIFIPNETNNTKTYAELELSEKNQISHRGKSLKGLREFLLTKYL